MAPVLSSSTAKAQGCSWGLSSYLPSCACTWLNNLFRGQRKPHDRERHKYSRLKLSAFTGRNNPQLWVSSEEGCRIKGRGVDSMGYACVSSSLKVCLPIAYVNILSWFPACLSVCSFLTHFSDFSFLSISCLNAKLVPSSSSSRPLNLHFLRDLIYPQSFKPH